MNEFFTQFKNRARIERLSHDEKQAMRVRLYNYIERNPAGAFSAPAKAARPVPSTFYFFAPRFAVPAMLILIIGVGSGTSFAAQGSLPGDTLYPVKIHVNEAVQTAFATTPEEKAQVNANLATARIEEAETLASTGKLNAAATQTLAANFTTHVNAAQANTDSLQSKNPGAAAQLGDNFNSILSAHGAILTQLGDDSSDNDTVQNSRSFAMEVESESHRSRNGGNNTFAAATFAIATDATATPPSTGGATSNANGTKVRTFAAVAPQAISAKSASTTLASTSASTTPTLAPTSKNKNKGKVTPPSDNSQEQVQIANSLQSEASSSLAAVVQDFAALNDSLDAKTSALITGQIQSMLSQYAGAVDSLAAGNTDDAKMGFTNVVRMSVKLDTYLKAGKKFNVRILSGLLTNSDSHSDSGKGYSNSGDDN